MSAVALAALFALPGVAGAAMRLHPQQVGTNTDWVLSDGDRYAAWSEGAGTAVIDDTVTGRLRRVALPDCEPDEVSSPPLLVAAGGGQLLATCYDHAFLIRLADGAIRTVGPPDVGNGLAPYEYSYEYLDVGRRWVAGSYTYYTGNQLSARTRIFLLDWHTGDMVWQRPTARRLVDPDQRSGTERLCAPLRRRLAGRRFLHSIPADPFVLPDGYLPFTYARPYGIEQRGGPRALRLQHCGTHHRIRLSRCRRSCDHIALNGRAVAWNEPTRIRVMLPATHRRAVIQLPADRSVVALALTHHAVLYTTTVPGRVLPPPTDTTWQVDLPSRVTARRRGSRTS